MLNDSGSAIGSLGCDDECFDAIAPKEDLFENATAAAEALRDVQAADSLNCVECEMNASDFSQTGISGERFEIAGDPRGSAGILT